MTTLNVYLPRHLGRIIRHCLEKEPKRRFQTALDLRNELEELRREMLTGEVRSGDVHASDVRSGSAPLRVVGDLSGSISREALSTRTDLAEILPRERDSEKLTGIAAALLVVAAIIALVWLRSGAESPGAVEEGLASAASEHRIVVLPMENLGPAEHAYFAAGITDEITSRLASVSALQVISRTTALQYDRAEKTAQQVGADLGVDYLLDGTVRWNTGAGAASRVRVTPQLIRVADDTQVWSERYDQVIDEHLRGPVGNCL